MIDLAEGLDQRRQVVAGEVGHQPRQLLVGPRLDQPRDLALVADLVDEPLAPSGAALEHQRRVELVRAIVDPLPQPLAARLAERLVQQRAVFEDHDLPAEGLEQRLVAAPQPLANDRVEALPVVIDDPPAIAQALLPAFEDRLEDIALVELGVADERDHAALGALAAPATGAHVVLHQRGEQGLRHAEPDRAGGEIDVVAVLAARGIALRALVAAKVLELLPALAAEEVLDGVIDRARMRLHRHAILRAQRAEIERGHDGRERGGRGLVSADLQAVGAGAQVVGVVNRPAREPQHLFLELAQKLELGAAWIRLLAFGHRQGIVACSPHRAKRNAGRAFRQALPSRMSLSSIRATNAHYGAISTCRQAGGRSAIRGPGRGFGGVGSGLGCSTASVNQWLSSLPQPSSAGRAGCGVHSGLSEGQTSRTWK